MMRERLIELITEIENNLFQAYPYTTDTFRVEETAKYLIEHGVIVPPCKVGDEFYMIDQLGNINAWIVIDMDYHITHDFMIHLSRKDDTTIGRTCIANDIDEILFFSYEEAERALKGVS